MAQIHYRKDADRGWRRVKSGTGFRFVDENGKAVSKTDAKRLTALGIPPGWDNVIVSSDPLDYIQAIGIDAKGRKQYIYHEEWTRRTQEKKFDQMVRFGERLPTLREAVRAHMREHTLSRDRIIATVVWLLEHTFIRVGNLAYAKENQSYGLTTMREKHVEVEGNTVRFSFSGKSGKYHELGVSHPRVAKTIRACLDLPGYHLFQYIDENNERQMVDSADVNEYLQMYIGEDFSAKDFRTWGGSVLAGDSLYQRGVASTNMELKKNILDMITTVSTHLGNTKKVCRTYYIHPTIITSYESGELVPHFNRSYSKKAESKLTLSPEEYATWSLIKMPN